jgi:hypothetical protein
VSPDPVSWLVAEPGWRVVARDGADLGRVHEVIGDPEQDIFNGISVSAGLIGSPRYVAAERVREIRAGEVELDLSADELERLED